MLKEIKYAGGLNWDVIHENGLTFQVKTESNSWVPIIIEIIKFYLKNNIDIPLYLAYYLVNASLGKDELFLKRVIRIDIIIAGSLIINDPVYKGAEFQKCFIAKFASGKQFEKLIDGYINKLTLIK